MDNLWIGQPNYSSWSLRGWLLCKIAGLDPELHWVRFDQDDWREQVPSRGLVPALQTQHGWVWDSLAIMETLAEQSDALLPVDPEARMHARSIIAEMHSGFSALRSECPMNIRGRAPNFELSQGVFQDISRIQDLLEAALQRWGGRYLYGDTLSAADAFYAPVIYRLRTYAPPAHCELADYSERLLAHPLLEQWQQWAMQEPASAAYDKFLTP
ncbi:MAG: glutathione S-transferase [Litorivicinus sp.]